MPKTFQFLAPSLHPNTLTEIAIPEAGPSAPEPIVRHLPIKYGAHQAVGSVKRMLQTGDDEIMVADETYRLSTISLRRDEEGLPTPPEVVRQHQAVGKAGNVWAGLLSVQSSALAALSSGSLHLLPQSSDSDIRTTSITGPLTCIASSSSSATSFAAAGKEVDVSIWDVERTFGSSREAAAANGANGKRKKTDLQAGELWQAKNVSNLTSHLAALTAQLSHDSLNLRPPIHHLALTYAPNSTTSLVSGTKSGSVRRYDTRQRKPLSDWKLAREGGIGAVAFGSSEHELFYADRSSLLAALDMRTGKMLYSVPSTCTVHHLVSFPSIDEAPTPTTSGRINGLAGISSDASLRVYATTPAPEGGVKGNWGGEGKKGGVMGMVGGVGVGGFVWRGYGSVAKVKPEKKEGDDEGDESDEEADEEVWEGMDEVGEGGGSDEEDEEDSDEEEEAPPVKKTKQQQKPKGRR